MNKAHAIESYSSRTQRAKPLPAWTSLTHHTIEGTECSCPIHWSESSTLCNCLTATSSWLQALVNLPVEDQHRTHEEQEPHLKELILGVTIIQTLGVEDHRRLVLLYNRPSPNPNALGAGSGTPAKIESLDSVQKSVGQEGLPGFFRAEDAHDYYLIIHTFFSFRDSKKRMACSDIENAAGVVSEAGAQIMKGIGSST